MRVGDVPVKNYRKFSAELERHADKPLAGHGSANLLSPKIQAMGTRLSRNSRTQELTFEVPTQPLTPFGFVMKMGPITAVQTIRRPPRPDWRRAT